MEVFRGPLGVYPIARDGRPAFRPRRGYRLTIFRDSGSPCFFEILLPVLEIFDVFRSLSDLLPEMVYPILERPPEPEEDLPPWPHGRFASLGSYMPRRLVLPRFLEHAFQIQNDGMLGAGMAGRTDEDAFREVFLDEHKTLRFITESPDEVHRLLDEHGVPYDEDLVLVSERPHAHKSLVALDELRDLFAEPELAYDSIFNRIARELGLPRRYP